MSDERRALLNKIAFSWHAMHAIRTAPLTPVKPTLFCVNFPPGPLGIGLVHHCSEGLKPAIAIKEIFAECPNAKKVQVGDKLVCVDRWPVVGRTLHEVKEELCKGLQRHRVLWLTRTETTNFQIGSSDTEETQMRKLKCLTEPTLL